MAKTALSTCRNARGHHQFASQAIHIACLENVTAWAVGFGITLTQILGCKSTPAQRHRSIERRLHAIERLAIHKTVPGSPVVPCSGALRQNVVLSPGSLLMQQCSSSHTSGHPNQSRAQAHADTCLSIHVGSSREYCSTGQSQVGRQPLGVQGVLLYRHLARPLGRDLHPFAL